MIRSSTTIEYLNWLAKLKKDAEAGDEQAKSRLETAKRLELRNLSRRAREKKEKEEGEE